MALSGPSILLVSGDWDERTLIASTLRGAGFVVARHAELRGAEMALREENFTAAVIVLPGADGIELLRRVRRANPGLKALVVVEPAAMPLADEDGATLIKRPFDARELLGCLFELVLRDDPPADLHPHCRAAEFGIAAAKLACLHNRHATAAAAGASRLAQDISRQIGETLSGDRALAAVLQLAPA